MLLTSGQVSVAISSFIIFFFTTALFLAGYVLQQQTVRDIRAVMKPQLTRAPPGAPELFLAKQFREDGYLVDAIVDPVVGPKDEEPIPGTNIEVRETQSEESSTNEEALGKETVDEEMIGATRSQKAARRKQLEAMKAGKGNTQQKLILDPPEPNSEDHIPQSSETQKQEEKLSRAARRKKIKEQIMADGEGESFKGYRRRMW